MKKLASKIVYNAEIMKIMSFFEKITGTRLKDCIIEERQFIFIVQPGMISKAIGKRGVNVKTLEKKLNKKIKIVEFNPMLKEFVLNYIMPIRVEEIQQDGNVITLMSADTAAKSMLIGRNAQNLRHTEEIIKRYFPQLEEIKVM